MKNEKLIPEYGTVAIGPKVYYRTSVTDKQGKRHSVYGHSCEEVYEKVRGVRKECGASDANGYSDCPTVKEYCEKWLYMQSARIRAGTMVDYESKVRNYIIKPLGHKNMEDVTTDDIKMAMVPVAAKSESVYHGVSMLMKSIFESALESNIIERNPAKRIPAKGGIKQQPREALSDEQAERLLDAVRDTPAYVFVMIGLYAGLRREEILALRWENVHLDNESPYIAVCEAWHTEHNQPVISEELKTRAARRNVPIPRSLEKCLREHRVGNKSKYVISNSKKGPLTYTEFRSLWKHIVTRTAGVKSYYRYADGKKTLHKFNAQMGTRSRNGATVCYTLDFHVTPHMLRHTYITNLISSGVDPKTVQYLAGHENSKITMDIYAKVKYNSPEELAKAINGAFGDN